MPEELINNIFDLCCNNNSNKNEIINLAKNTISEGHSIQQILLNMNKKIILYDLSDNIKANISYDLLKIEKRIMMGADEYIQLLNIFLSIKKYFIILT